MSSRDQLKTIRPNIATISIEKSTSDAERFQNQCLRPILKLQNELLLALFQQYIRKRKNKYLELNEKKQLEYIEHSIRQDLKFKNLLVGTIIGQFTLEELEQFQQAEKELTRRITDMLVLRLQSQLIKE